MIGGESEAKLLYELPHEIRKIEIYFFVLLKYQNFQDFIEHGGFNLAKVQGHFRGFCFLANEKMVNYQKRRKSLMLNRSVPNFILNNT